MDEQIAITNELLVMDLANEFNALIGSKDTMQRKKPAVNRTKRVSIRLIKAYTVKKITAIANHSSSDMRISPKSLKPRKSSFLTRTVFHRFKY